MKMTKIIRMELTCDDAEDLGQLEITSELSQDINSVIVKHIPRIKDVIYPSSALWTDLYLVKTVIEHEKS